MREITILKDGFAKRIPIISKRVRNTVYFVLALSFIMAALLKRHGTLEPSMLVTNIAVIAMVCYPVAVIFSLLARFLLGLIASDEFTVTSRKIYGYTTLGKLVDIPLEEILDAFSFVFIFKSLAIKDKDGKVYRFIGLGNANRISLLIKHLAETEDDNSRIFDTKTELQKYASIKELGLITASELEAIKKQIIGL